MAEQADFDLDTNTTTAAPEPGAAPKRKPLKKAAAKADTAPAPKKKAPAKKPAAPKASVSEEADTAPAPKKPKPKPKSPSAESVGDPSGNVIGGNAQAELRSFLSRVVRLEEEKAEIAAEIKDVYAEAKLSGFDTKIMRKLISEAKRDPKELDEQRALLDLYRDAAGDCLRLES